MSGFGGTRPLLVILLAAAAVSAVDGTLAASSATAPTSPPPAAPELLFRSGDYAAAAAAFAADLAARSPADEVGRGRLHFDLGACRLRLGQLAEAEYQMRRAVLLLGAQGPPLAAEAAAAREGLATVLIAQGNMIEAEEVLELSLAARRSLWGDGHPQVLRTLDLLAGVHWLDGDPQRALDLYVEVMSGLRAIHGNVHPLTATTAQNIGAMQMELSTDFTAEIMFRQAAYITDVLYGEGHPEMVAPLCGLGDIMARAGMLDRAETYYARALATVAARRSSDIDDTHERVRSLIGLARVKIAQGAPDLALPLLREAAARHDRLRALAGGDMEAATVGGSPRPLLAHALLLLGRPAEAWRALEGGRGRLLAAWRDARGDSLRAVQLDIEARLAGDPDPGERRRLESRWNECDAAFTTRAAAGLAVSAGVSLEAARAVLAADEAMLGWLDAPLAGGRRATWAYVLNRDGDPIWRRLPDQPWRQSPKLLHRYREVVAGVSPKNDLWEALADSVWTQRFAPVAPALAGKRRLLVVTAEPMGGIPLAPLGPRGGPMLLERFELQVASSAHGLTLPAASTALLSTRPALVVADPPYAGRQVAPSTRTGVADSGAARVDMAPASGVIDSAATMPDAALLRSALGNNRAALDRLPRLTASRDEAAAIRSFFPAGPTLLGAAASEAGLSGLSRAGELPRMGLVHLATHALVDGRAPDRSALVLADRANRAGASEDGLLTSREVRLGWQLDAELVTLSACETGLGRQTYDDGMLSLTASFVAAGARNVVSSLWKVEDRATATLMSWFYEELSRAGTGNREVTVAGALRAAQLRLRDHWTAGGTRPWSAPWAWGGFVAYGGAARR